MGDMDRADLGSQTSLLVLEGTVHILLKPGLENFEHYFASV